LRKVVIAIIAINRMKKRTEQVLDANEINKCLRLFKEKPFVGVVEFVTDNLQLKQKSKGFKSVIEMLSQGIVNLKLSLG
jgi:hypothetical protein